MKESLVFISLKRVIYNTLAQFVDSVLQWTEQRRLELRLITLDLSHKNTPKRLDSCCFLEPSSHVVNHKVCVGESLTYLL